MPTGPESILIFVLLISLIFVLLSLILIGLLYTYKRRQTIYQQQLAAVKLEAEKHVLSAKIEMQENTFQEIGREIHDNVSLSLTVAKLYLNLFKREKDTKKVDEATEIVSDAISTLRDMSKGFSSEILNDHGLVIAIEHEIERIRKAGLFEIDLTISDEVPYMDTQKELVIFRMIQESFSNIIRHSQASKASLSLDIIEEALVIGIADNDIGINIKHPSTDKTGTGLSSIRLRTKFIGGSFRLQSSIGEGTLIRIAIPI